MSRAALQASSVLVGAALAVLALEGQLGGLHLHWAWLDHLGPHAEQRISELSDALRGDPLQPWLDTLGAMNGESASVATVLNPLPTSAMALIATLLPPVLGINLLMLVLWVAGAAAVRFFARSLGLSELASTCAGLIALLHPWTLDTLRDRSLDQLPAPWLPLALAGMVAVRRGGPRLHAAMGGVSLCALALSNPYHLATAPLLLLATAIAVRGGRTPSPSSGRTVPTWQVDALLCLPPILVATPVVVAQLGILGTRTAMTAPPALVWMNGTDAPDLPAALAMLGVQLGGTSGIVLLLALLGAIRRPRLIGSLLVGGLATVGYISAGMSETWPFALQELGPLWRAREPTRVGIAAVIPLAVAAGVAVDFVALTLRARLARGADMRPHLGTLPHLALCLGVASLLMLGGSDQANHHRLARAEVPLSSALLEAVSEDPNTLLLHPDPLVVDTLMLTVELGHGGEACRSTHRACRSSAATTLSGRSYSGPCRIVLRWVAAPGVPPTGEAVPGAPGWWRVLIGSCGPNR